MSRLLPLFPLQLVAFPGTEIPLHIFEPRYKLMVGNAEREGTEFGIVLAREGGVVDAGCTVKVESVLHRYPDGRFDVVTRGQRRFKISSLDQDLEYLRGEVEFFDDDDWTPVPTDIRDRAMSAFQSMLEVLTQIGERVSNANLDPDHPHLSFHLAQTLDDLDFQNAVLRNRSEVERLKHFTSFTPDYIARKQYVAKMKRTAPTNGHGHNHNGTA